MYYKNKKYDRKCKQVLYFQIYKFTSCAVQLFTSSKFSVAMSTDPAMMAEAAGMLQERPSVDLLWIVASICFFVVFSLFVILIVVFARSSNHALYMSPSISVC